MVFDAMDCSGIHPALHQAPPPHPHHCPVGRLHGHGTNVIKLFRHDIGE